MYLDKRQGVTEGGACFGYIAGDNGGWFFTWRDTLRDTLETLEADSVDGDGGIDRGDAERFLSERIRHEFASFELIFDNSGGALLQTANREYVAAFADMAALADCVRRLLAGESPAGWDGHNPDLYVTDRDYASFAPLGGYRCWDQGDCEQISEMDAGGWCQMEAFREELTRLQSTQVPA